MNVTCCFLDTLPLVILFHRFIRSRINPAIHRDTGSDRSVLVCLQWLQLCEVENASCHGLTGARRVTNSLAWRRSVDWAGGAIVRSLGQFEMLSWPRRPIRRGSLCQSAWLSRTFHDMSDDVVVGTIVRFCLGFHILQWKKCHEFLGIRLYCKPKQLNSQG